MSKSQQAPPASSESDMEDDIHVQFPEVNSQHERLWPASEVSNGNRGKEILVVMLGWAGAEHKYLSKYSEFYLKRGCIVLRYITPIKFHLLRTQKLPEISRKILKFITDLQLNSHPIYFHVFSNGGSFTYSYMLKELANPKGTWNFDVRGTIFDSAPSPRRLQTTFIALLSIFSFLKIFRYPAAALVIFILLCQVFWFHIKTAVKFCIYGDNLDSLEAYDKEVAPLTNWLERIAKMKNHNFLFLYSDADELILAERVEKFASIVESRGNNVEKVKFAGSEHVMHYRRYPKEYGDAVTDFVRSSMKQSRGKTMFYEE